MLPYNFGFGQFFDFLKPEKIIEYYNYYTLVAERTNSVCIATFFGKPYLLVHDPDIIKQISVVHGNKFPKTPQFYEELKISIGNGLVTSEGELWKRERSLINPIFTHGNISTMIEDMKDSTLKAVKKFSENTKIEYDFSKEMSILTLEVIIRCGFGSDEDPKQVASWWNEVDQYLMPYILALFALPKGFVDRIPYFYLLLTNLGMMKRFLKNLIEKKKNKEADGTLISLLINAHDNNGKIDEEILMAESLTFLLAGHETTATLLSWIGYELCLNPDIQDRAYKEIKSIVKDGEITWEKVESMKYIKFIINESLRLHPPVFEVDKIATEDIKIGDLFIPKDTSVGFNIYGLHTSEKIWKNANKFDPDRWEEDNIKKIPNLRYSFIPFSVGSRDCVGKLFTLTEAPLILTYLLYHFKLDFSDKFKGLVVDSSLTCKPKDLFVKITRRTQ